MKVAHIITTFLPKTGGAELTVHNVLAQQAARGVDVTGIVPWRSWRQVRTLVPYRLLPLLPATAWLFTRVGQKRVFRLLLARQLEFFQRRHRFDIWHAYMAYISGTLVAAALPGLGVPAILTCQGEGIQKLPELNYGVRLDPQIDELVIQSLPDFDRLTAISQSVRGEYLDAGVPAWKIRDIPNGVDIARFEKFASNRLQTRKSLNLPDDKFVLLSVGRNHPVKAFHLIPRMIRQLLLSRSDFIWVIVGRGATDIRAQAIELGVDRHLRTLEQIAPDAKKEPEFALPPAELIRIYAAADIFVFPSLIEAFGIVLVEAMAAGLPIVTTDARGIRDIIKHEINGLQSPAGDSSEMAGNILRLLEDASLRRRLIEKGKRQAADYDWPRVASRYLDLYEELA